MAERKYSLADAGPRIENFLRTILRLAGFQLNYALSDEVSLQHDFENPEIIVRFTGPDVELLLANKAELLLALEQLTMELLRMPSEDHSRLCFDANDHRMLRIEELRLSALTAAEKVRKTRIPFQFSPMNSRERRIIHLALRNEAGVRSESVGEGPYRQVCIVPADMKTLPEPSRPMRPGPPDRPRFGRGGREGHGGREDRGGRPSRPRR